MDLVFVFQIPRQSLRDDFNGIPLLINLIDSTLFGQRELSPCHTQSLSGTSDEASKSKIQSSEAGRTTSEVSRDPHCAEVDEEVSGNDSEQEAKTSVLGNHDAEELSNKPTDGN